MKQALCTELREISSAEKAERERHRKTMEKLDAREREIKAQCDHKYPNGQIAIKGDFMFSQCEICGWNDL